MTAPPIRPRLDPPHGEGCLSDLTLDRLLDGELAGRPEEKRARAHLEICAQCRARRAEIEVMPPLHPDEALRRQVSARATPPRRRRAPGPASRSTSIIGAISLLAVAAGVLLIARPRPPAPRPDAPETRVKGAEFGFEVLARRRGGDRAEPVLPETPLHRGDAIGFRVRSGSGGYLAIVSVDGAGRIASYLPGPLGELSRLPPGQSALDTSVILDAVTGRETLIAVLCPQRADAAQALDATRAAVSRAADGGRAVPSLGLPCAEARAAFMKEER